MPRPTLFQSRKFQLALRRLNIPAPHLLGHLEFVWESANQSGESMVGCWESLEAVAMWDGEPGVFAKTLSMPGTNFFDVMDDGIFEIHDYWDHAPEYVRDRRRKEQLRKDTGKKLRGESNKSPDISDNYSEKSDTPAPAPAPAPAQKESFPGPADAVHGEIVLAEPNLDLPDPLEKLPALSKAYAAIQGRIKEVHPRVKLPKPGTQADFDARRCLARLVSLDKYSEQEILATLRWVLYTEPESDFTWRAQFHSIANLRHVKGGLSKFAKMHNAMTKARTAPPKPDPAEDLPDYIRDAMKAAGKL